MLAIVRLALRRPYTFVVMAILIAIYGTLAAVRTPVDIFPNIGIPVISVIWSYSGLPPDDMSGRIIYFYERSLTTTVNDIEHIESQSLAGFGIVKIFFQPTVDINAAQAQVTSISQTVLKLLPPGVTPPFVLSYNASSVPIIQVALSSDKLSQARLNDLGLNFIRPPQMPMRRLFISALFLAVILGCTSRPALAVTYTPASGYVEQGGQRVVTGGSTSTTKVQKSYPGATVKILLTGTSTLATIYSNSSGTAKSNPFAASSTGFWFFFAANGTYDVQFSGTGITTPWTITVTIGSGGAAARATFLNVLDYDALCDGSTDDTTAIRAAITAAKALGGTVKAGGTIYFPRKSTACKVTGELNFDNTKGIKLLSDLYGNGGNPTDAPNNVATLMFTQSGSGNLISARSSSGFVMEGMVVSYNSASFTGTVLNLKASTSNTSHARIEKCMFNGALASQSFATYLIDASEAVHIKIRDSYFLYARTGINALSSYNVDISGSTFIRMATAAIVNPSVLNVIQNNNFEPGGICSDNPYLGACGGANDAVAGNATGIYMTGTNFATGPVIIQDNFFGDGSGMPDIRPWITVAGYNTSIKRNYIATAGPTMELIRLDASNGTIHEVLLENNYYQGVVGAPIVKKTGPGTVASLTSIHDFNPNGAPYLTEVGSAIQEKVFINQDGLTDFKTGYREYGRSVKAGTATPISFLEGNFTASSGNWTLTSGDQVTAYYSLDGKVLDLWFDFVTTTVSATPGGLRFALPNSLTAAITGYVGTIEYRDNAAAAAMGTAYVVSGNGYVGFFTAGGANWSTATDTTQLHGHVRIPVN